MGTARYRNQLEQKSLGRKLDSLSTHFRCTSRKLMTVMGQLEEQLSLMAPVGSKVIVCPKGQCGHVKKKKKEKKIIGTNRILLKILLLPSRTNRLFSPGKNEQL